jgi:hypothetical protein
VERIDDRRDGDYNASGLENRATPAVAIGAFAAGIATNRDGAMRQIFALLAVLAVGIALSASVSACPNCKEAVAAQPAEVASMAKGYNWSVMFMLGMPATLLGTGTFMVVRAVKRGTLPEM